MTKRLLKKKCEYPNKDLRILAYFNTGHRTRMATNKLQALGFPFKTETTRIMRRDMR
jgi:hypothetical protein